MILAQGFATGGLCKGDRDWKTGKLDFTHIPVEKPFMLNGLIRHVVNWMAFGATSKQSVRALFPFVYLLQLTDTLVQVHSVGDLFLDYFFFYLKKLYTYAENVNVYTHLDTRRHGCSHSHTASLSGDVAPHIFPPTGGWLERFSTKDSWNQRKVATLLTTWSPDWVSIRY